MDNNYVVTDAVITNSMEFVVKHITGVHEDDTEW